MRIGRLLFPALRWSAGSGFDHEADKIETALELGAGGFILFGGEAEVVRRLTGELRRRAGRPLLIGADLERGAGQQFAGATPLPPLAALGALDDLDVTRRAAELTAREAVALGVNWIYAPTADLDIEPRNPIVGTRAFGSDAGRVAEHVVAWIEGCRAGSGLSCAKHFPGHGRTTVDSHVELPSVTVDRQILEADLLPFRAAVRAGADSIMTAHVAYPALDPSGAAATLSHAIVTGLLRRELGYDGLVVTDALIMEGVLESGRGEAGAAVQAVAAGCDALLYPEDLRTVAEVVAGEVGIEVPEARVAEAVGRIEAAAGRAAPGGAGEWGREEDAAWALDTAVRSIQPVRGRPPAVQGAVRLVTVDDDVGGPYPPPTRAAFPAALRAAGVEVGEVDGAPADASVVVAVYADIRAWKGRPGISQQARDAVSAALADAPGGVVVLFGHPRLAADLAVEAPVVSAWGGEPLMQQAAARWLVKGAGG